MLTVTNPSANGAIAQTSAPYDEVPTNVRSRFFPANLGVLNGNVYRTDILTVRDAFRP